MGVPDDNTLRTTLAEGHAASYGWALACCGRDAWLAEDVLQTAYVKVLQGRARFAGQSAFQTWWFAVIRRTAADERRRLWLRRLKHLAFSRQPDLADPSPDPDRQARFAAALAQLPARQREVLHLVFYQELTIEQAAAVMGVSLGTARTHYERGKQRLRHWLQTTEVSDEPATHRSPAPATVR
jgi:RNA polymerase sigma-70 factor (ECF subfamily)